MLAKGLYTYRQNFSFSLVRILAKSTNQLYNKMKKLSCCKIIAAIGLYSLPFTAVSQTIKYYTAADAVKIAYTDTGSGKTVVLLHGFINTGANWRKTQLYKDACQKGYRVIVPDLRGNGGSDKPHEDKYYENDAEIADIMGMMRSLKIKKYNVVGYSRGAIVAAKLITKDKRVVKAVLGGMGQHFTNPNWERRIMFAAAFSGKSQLYPEAQGAVKYAKSINADTVALGLLQKYQPVTSAASLLKYKHPVLVIAGDEDMDNGDPAVLKTYFKQAVLKIVKGNHNSTYNTAEFSNGVIDFLQH
jgi:pimeloyl-ACP methyl ester carboxylesterase